MQAAMFLAISESKSTLVSAAASISTPEDIFPLLNI
jgi:hypothetical protein